MHPNKVFARDANIGLVPRWYRKSNLNSLCLCDVTPSVYPHREGLKNMPGHSGIRTYDLCRCIRKNRGLKQAGRQRDDDGYSHNDIPDLKAFFKDFPAGGGIFLKRDLSVR